MANFDSILLFEQYKVENYNSRKNFSNLTAKSVGNRQNACYAQSTLWGGINDFNSSKHQPWLYL